MSSAPGETPLIEAEPARPVEAPTSLPRSDRARQTSYRSRFVAVYVALAVIAGVGVGAFLVLLARPEAKEPPAWSTTFVPAGSEAAKAKQIASWIAGRYKLANGQQLAAALVGPPAVSAGASQGGDIPVRAIAIRPDTSTGKKEEECV